MMKEPPIRIEDVLNGKYRFVEGQPIRRSYVDMENMVIENMKYKVGDKVKIKSLDWYNENKDETDDIECSNNIWFYREMSKFCGKVMTISHIRADHYTMVEDLVGYWTDEMIECKVEEECPQDFIEKYCRTCGTQRCDRTKEYLNGCPYYNAYIYKTQNNGMKELKFKTGDRVFNKVTRKWVNIIEFDIETGLYIVRYDDGLQGRSLESELRFMEEETDSKFKEIIKKKAEEYINSKTELGSMSKSFLYEGFVDGMMTALKIMEE